MQLQDLKEDRDETGTENERYIEGLEKDIAEMKETHQATIVKLRQEHQKEVPMLLHKCFFTYNTADNVLSIKLTWHIHVLASAGKKPIVEEKSSLTYFSCFTDFKYFHGKGNGYTSKGSNSSLCFLKMGLLYTQGANSFVLE